MTNILEATIDPSEILGAALAWLLMARVALFVLVAVIHWFQTEL